MNEIEIVLPSPHPKLHAHNTGHWRSKAGPTKELRTLAKALAMQARPHRFKTWDKASVDYTFYLKTARRRDMANLIQSQKAAIDGVVDAGVIVDDDWKHLSIGRVSCEVDRVNPRVVLTFRKDV